MEYQGWEGRPEPITPRPKGLGILPYIVAAAVAAAGVVGFAVFLLTGLSGMNDGLTQVVAPGVVDLDLTEDGTYTIFHEYRSVIDGQVYSSPPGGVSGLNFRVVDKETGEEIPVAPTTSNMHYDLGGRSGHGILSFVINRPGTHQLSTYYLSGAKKPRVALAVGHGFMKNLFTLIFSCIGILFGSLGLAAVIAVVTLARRVSQKSAAPSTAGYGRMG